MYTSEHHSNSAIEHCVCWYAHPAHHRPPRPPRPPRPAYGLNRTRPRASRAPRPRPRWVCCWLSSLSNTEFELELERSSRSTGLFWTRPCSVSSLMAGRGNLSSASAASSLSGLLVWARNNLSLSPNTSMSTVRTAPGR